MAKKKEQTPEEVAQRQSRKEVLLARKQEQQMRRIRLGAYIVGGLLLLVLLVGLVNEFLIVPNRAVAVVNGEDISLSQWRDRVTYERAQRIVFLENQYEAFEGNVGIIQQFAGQSINDLLDSEGLGQAVLNQMVDEVVIRQAAQERGISVSEADIDAYIGESFNYFNGESPTPFPTATATIMPTPSLTPIPTAVITEVVPTNTPFPTATIGPTATPRPTATPVSAESFQTELDDLVSSLTALGAKESVYRSVVAAQLYREQLADALAEEQALPKEAEQANLFQISTTVEADAQELLAMVESEGYLTVWNTLRSGEAEIQASASEIMGRLQEDLAQELDDNIAQEAFSLPLDTPSGVLERDMGDETKTYYIIQVSGREVKPLSDSRFQSNKLQALSNFIDTQLAGNLELTDVATGRAPSVPVIDQKFLAAPTPQPADPSTLTIPDTGDGGN
ncbi:MAG: SurA N-terminal domain-containing protein [Chloroflexota bacterium]